MDLRQLRHFVALADHRSFVRAADAIGLSQPAFSRSIQTLERDLDSQLVDRASREFRLTGQGELVLQHARRLLAGSRALRNELVQYNGLTAGELRFGSGPYPAQLLVPEALADFIRDHPAIRTAFHQGDWEQLARWLKEEQIEFFVADSRYFTHIPEYQVQLLRPRRGRFFCRLDHPLAARAEPRLAELMDFPLVGTRIPGEIRKVLGAIAGLDDFQPSVECSQFDAILRMVARSDAVGISTLEALHGPAARGEVQMLKFSDVPPGSPSLLLHFGIVNRAGYSLSPAAQAMVAAIHAADQRLASYDEG